jgi:hypothetical protein
MKHVRILLDLDGVIVDFRTQYKKINGVYPDDVYAPGKAPTPEKTKYWNAYVNAAGFEDAPVLNGAPELLAGITKLMKEGRIHLVEICTSAGGKERFEDATRQKKVWLELHGLGDLVAHIVQNGYKKADVIDKKFTDILIDDTENIVENFRKHGGIAILHKSVDSTLKELEYILSEGE